MIMKDQPNIGLLDQYLPVHPTKKPLATAGLVARHDGSIELESRYDYEQDHAHPSKSDYHENFYHDVKKVKVVVVVG